VITAIVSYVTLYIYEKAVSILPQDVSSNRLGRNEVKTKDKS